jgi:tetratricopeptide (TPR) repeat protein
VDEVDEVDEVKRGIGVSKVKRMNKGWLKRGTAVLVLAAALPVFGAEPEEAQFNVVAGLYNAGQWQAAVAKIQEREKTELTEGMRAKYLLAKGMAYEKGQKVDEARAAYDELLSKFASALEAQSARVAVIYMDYAKGEAKGAGDAVLGNIAKLDVSKLSAGDKKNLALIKAESLYARTPDKAALDAYKEAAGAGADATAMAAKVFDLYLRLGMNAELVAHSANGVTGVPTETVAMVRAQAFLALGKFAEAVAEATKVPSSHGQYANAAYIKAQAMLKQGQLKEAVGPLETAIAGMKEPAAPVMARLALVECLVEAGRGEDAARALSKARVAVDTGPEDQKGALKGQIALLDVRVAVLGADRQKVIDAVTRARPSTPKEQLSKLLYLRLVKLAEGKEPGEVLATYEADMPVFEASPEYGAAAGVYASAFKKAGKADQAAKVLTAYIAKHPETAEGLKARVSLASDAIGKGDYAGAAAQLDAVIATAGAPEKLGKDVFDEALFNRGVAAEKLNDHAGAVKAYAALVARAPQAAVAKKAALQLGQAYAAQKDYAKAAAVWKKALADGAEGGLAGEADVRDRLARVLFAAKDYAGAVEQVGLGVKAAGGVEKVSKESREVWARSLFALNKFAEAGGVFAGLAGQYKDLPGYAFEAGVAYEKGGDLVNAEKWYAVAVEGKGKLSTEYAGVVDAKVAGLRLSSGVGDMGASRWLAQIAEAKDAKGFETAAGALRKIAAAGKLDAAGQEKLKGVMEGAAVTDAKRYAVGAIVVEAKLALGQVKEAGLLADGLVVEFGKNEKGLDAKSSGATVAPAVFYFAQGEALRAKQEYPGALAAYETVISAYPVNHWPDAAACGAAECLLIMGDKQGAVEKFKEVVKSAGTAGAGKVWREKAEGRLKEIGG